LVQNSNSPQIQLNSKLIQKIMYDSYILITESIFFVILSQSTGLFNARPFWTEFSHEKICTQWSCRQTSKCYYKTSVLRKNTSVCYESDNFVVAWWVYCDIHV